MQDRTTTITEAHQTPTQSPARSVAPMTGRLSAAAPVQQDEFLRRARIESAQAAAVATGRRLDNTYLDSAERWNLEREHETNLHRLAVLRTEAGTGTITDYRLLHPEATQIAEDRFWASDDSWDTAGRQLTADLAGISTAGAAL